MADGRPLVSIITPAYDEAENLPLLHQRLSRVLEGMQVEWEWIVVDDHSADATFSVMAEMARGDSRVRCFRFARNFGSHTAIMCGLEHARGACAVVMAADLQDPPETLSELLGPWREGAQVVWAVRRRRMGEKASTIGFASLYYLMMRTIVGLRTMPATGADFFLVDRLVVDALKQFGERNVSLLALVTWMGFRQVTISYDKQVRVHGRSGWTLEKKVKLTVDSVTAFTYLPVRLMAYLGLVTTAAGGVYAALVLTNALAGHAVQGWSTVVVMLLVFSGLQMLMLGILGEYLWRALDESRRRPRYLIEAMTGWPSLPEPVMPGPSIAGGEESRGRQA